MRGGHWPERHPLLDSAGYGDWRADADECRAHLVEADGAKTACGLRVSTEIGGRVQCLDPRQRDLCEFCESCFASASRLNEDGAVERRLLYELNRASALGAAALAKRLSLPKARVQFALDRLADRQVVDWQGGAPRLAALAAASDDDPRRGVRGLWPVEAPPDRDDAIGQLPQRILGLLLDHDCPMTPLEIGLRLRVEPDKVDAALAGLAKELQLRRVAPGHGAALLALGRERARHIRAEHPPRPRDLEQLRRLIERYGTAPPDCRQADFAARSDRRIELDAARQELVALARPFWEWSAGLRLREFALSGREVTDPLLDDRLHQNGFSNSRVPLFGGALEMLARCDVWCGTHVALALEDLDRAAAAIAPPAVTAAAVPAPELTLRERDTLRYLEEDSFQSVAMIGKSLHLGDTRTRELLKPLISHGLAEKGRNGQGFRRSAAGAAFAKSIQGK